METMNCTDNVCSIGYCNAKVKEVIGTEQENKKIKLYKTNNCPWCKKTLAYLTKKGVDFEICNCSENEAYKEELIAKSRQVSVPVIDINGKIIIGFDRKRIDEALEVK